MVALHTPSGDLGAKAPDFSLIGIDQQTHTLASCAGKKGLLVMFICNHCPFVKAIINDLVADCRKLQQAGVGVVAIMPNDTIAYPEDSFDKMAIFAEKHQMSFPYLYDATQTVAKAYGAVCTPDFFGYDAALQLCYRGRFDATGRNREEESNHELLQAMLHVANTGTPPAQQTPSIGCSIKWRDAA